MITIHFENVGIRKLSWSESMMELTYDNLMRSIRRKKALMSRYPDFQMKNDTEGIILAGFHFVGTFRVEEHRRMGAMEVVEELDL